MKLRDKIKVKKYIKRALKNGHDKEQIVEVLERIKWNRTDVENIIDEITKKKKYSVVFEFPKSKPPIEVVEEPSHFNSLASANLYP